MFEVPDAAELGARRCFEALDSSVAEQRRLEARRFALVAQWADLHCPPPPSTLTELRTRARAVGAEGTPEVTEFAAAELGLALGTSTITASLLLGDVLNVRHRLPTLWRAVMTGELDAWKARQVARATARLSCQQARWVDTQVLSALTGLPFGRALAVVEGKVLAADPAGHERRRVEEDRRRYVAKGRATNPFGLRTLVAQTTAGDVARIFAMVEHLASILAAGGDSDSADVRRAKALGLLAIPAMACVLLARAGEVPASSDEPSEPAEPEEPPSTVELAVEVGRVLDALGVEQLRDWLGTEQVAIKPVVDVATRRSVDRYEVPTTIAEAIVLRQPFEIFPWGTLASRAADLDHTVPYVAPDEGGPPEQTSTDNLGPLGRGHHRAKTFGGFLLHQPEPGTYLWRTPTGFWFCVDHRGTRALGARSPMEARLEALLGQVA